jgi:hypothetical protein
MKRAKDKTNIWRKTAHLKQTCTFHMLLHHMRVQLLVAVKMRLAKLAARMALLMGLAESINYREEEEREFGIAFSNNARRKEWSGGM